MKSKKVKWGFLRIILGTYVFLLFIVRDYISETHAGLNDSSYMYIFPLGCIFSVEVLNQISYQIANRSERRAIGIKACVFWLLVTLFFVSDIYITMQAERKGEWILSEKIFVLALYLIVSIILPLYSFCPYIRFFFLYGRYKNSGK